VLKRVKIVSNAYICYLNSNQSILYFCLITSLFGWNIARLPLGSWIWIWCK